MIKNPTFRIIFKCGTEIIEIYANQVFQSELWGFLEVESFIVEASDDSINNKVKKDFTGIKRSYIPITSIVRIDELEQRESSKKPIKSGSNIKPFPKITR
jgi:hypothetical protein